MIALLLAAAVVVSAIPIGALRVSAATLVQLSGSVMDQVTGSGIADVTVTLTSETSDAVCGRNADGCEWSICGKSDSGSCLTR